MADVMKLGLILSATDKMSRIVDQAMGKSFKSMSNFQKRSKAIGGSLQKSGAVMMAAGTAIAGALFANFNAVNEKAKEVQFTSQKIGLSTEEFQKLSYAAKRSNVSVEQFQVGMGKLSKTMVLAAHGEKASQKIMSMMGVSAKDINGKLKTTAKVIQELSDKYKNAKDGPTKVALAMLAFGKSGKDMIPMLNKGGKAIEDLGNKFRKSNAYLSRENIAAFGKYRASVANTKLQLDGLKNQIAISTLPTAIKLADKISKLADKFGNWIKRNQDLFSTLVKVASVIAGLLIVMGAFNVVSGTVIKFVGTVSKAMSLAKNSMLLFKIQYYALAAAQKVSAMWTAITTSSVWAFTAALLANPITWVVIGIVALVAGLVLAWKKFEGFRAAVKTTWAVVKGFGNILKEYVLDRIKGIISGLGSMGRAIGLLFKGKFAAAGKEALKGVKDLSGYSAAENAMKKTVKLTQNIKPTFSKILAQEKAIVKDKEKATVQAHKESKVVQIHSTNKRDTVKTVATNSTVNSNAPVIHYAPVIHLNGGSLTDKADFMKLLKDNQKEFEQFLKKIAGNNQRISYQAL